MIEWWYGYKPNSKAALKMIPHPGGTKGALIHIKSLLEARYKPSWMITEHGIALVFTYGKGERVACWEMRVIKE